MASQRNLILVLMVICGVQSHRLSSIVGGLRVAKRSPVNDMKFIRLKKEGSLFQEDDSQYPETDAERLLAELERKNLTIHYLNNQSVHKVHDDEQNSMYMNLCKATRMHHVIRNVEDDSGEKFFVLNPKSKPVQYFDIEVCSTETIDSDGDGYGSCQLVEDVGFGNRARCMQQYLVRKIVVLTNTQPRKLTTMNAKIESCCSCVLES